MELRILDEARSYLAQGIWLQRGVAPCADRVRPALEWALEVASAGQPLPPLGFVADLGHAALGVERAVAGPHAQFPEIPGLAPGLARTYEDHVLGKLFADWTFERAGDAVRRYQGRDRARGLAFILQQFRDRAGFGGVHLSPAVIKGWLEKAPEELLATGWDSLTRDGIMPVLVTLYESLISASRRTAEVLAPEDIFELEHGTALAEMGERVALRQVLQAAARLEGELPRVRIRPSARRQEVPTRILDEDTYPVGGFSSISTRGSIESLLHSQLVFMEGAAGSTATSPARPDLFDIKYLREELLYYSRDENRFLRRRRTFVFALYPDLVQSRFKDANLPWQRGVVLLGLLLVTVRKLTEWLTTDALRFEFVWVSDNESEGLTAERKLMETVLREAMANGSVAMERVSPLQVGRYCALRARRSLCHCLVVSTQPREVTAEDTLISRLEINGPRPRLGLPGDPVALVNGDTPLDSWSRALEALLGVWV